MFCCSRAALSGAICRWAESPKPVGDAVDRHAPVEDVAPKPATRLDRLTDPAAGREHDRRTPAGDGDDVVERQIHRRRRRAARRARAGSPAAASCPLRCPYSPGSVHDYR